MIIKKLDIENFGKFSGRSFDFKPGFNLIFGNNEDGKSTLMAFIKLMFFGGSSGKSSDISKNLRKKYTPWSGAPMSGAVEFSSGDEDIRLHKEFKKSSTSDKTTIFNMTLGENIPVSTADEMGKVFFDMELGEFERSVFIETFGGFTSEGSSDSLAMRIANLSVSGDENFSQATILSRISAAKEELVSKSGKKGLLVDAESKLNQLKFEREKLAAKIQEQYYLMCDIDALKKDISLLESQLENLDISQKVSAAKKELKILSVLLEKIGQKSHVLTNLGKYSLTFDSIKEILKDCRELKSRIAQGFAIPNQNTDAVISDNEFSRLLDIQNSLSQLDNDVNHLHSGITRTRGVLDNLVSGYIKKTKLTSLIYLILSLILGIGCIAILPSLFYVGILFFAVGLGLFLGLRHNIAAKVIKKIPVRLAKQDYESNLRLLSFYHDGLLQNTLTELEDIIDSKRQEALQIIDQKLSYYGCNSIAELEQKTVSAQNTKLSAVSNSINALKVQFVSLLSQAHPCETFEQATMLFAELESMVSDLETVEHDIETIYKTSDLRNLEAEDIENKISQLSSFIEEMQIDSDTLSADPEQIKAELTQRRLDLGELQSKISFPEINESDLDEQIKDTTQQLAEYKERYKSLNLVSEAMDAAIAEMNKGLGTRLNQKTGEYLKLMSGGKYCDVLVSRDLNIETRQSPSEAYHQWKYLSSGAIDRVYLALRLAATDIIAEKHNPLPLFLDDILAQYDDKNCRNTLEFLNQYQQSSGSASQIFLFTCHKHIADMAKETFKDLTEIIL